MNQNRNHLVPTTIVNKNGVQTIVYRKESASAKSRSHLPSPVTMSAGSTDNAEWLNAHLEKLPDISDETMLNASKSFFEPVLSTLAKQLLDSGTATGQRLVTDSLSYYVGRVAEHLHKTGKTSITGPNHTGSMVHSEIIRKWNYGNIREEANIAPDTITQDELDDFKYAHSTITAGISIYDDISEEDQYRFTAQGETYWRGVSTLALCFDFEEDSEEANKEWENFDAFIPWAAAHDDIGSVIRIAKKHRTITPEKLAHIMEAEASGVHGVMTKGWL